MPEFTNRIARSLSDKLGERPSALDFIPEAQHAAVRAGIATSNLTSAIQSGLNALANAGGGVLYLPWGVYPVMDLTIPGNVFLQGDGAARTILKRIGNLAAGRGVLNFAGMKSGCGELAIDGQVTTPATALYSSLSDPSSSALVGNSSIRIHPGAADITLFRCRIFHTGGYAVHIDARTENVYRVQIIEPHLHDNRSFLFGATAGSEIYGSWTGGILAQGDGLTNSYGVRGLTVRDGRFRRGTGNQVWSHLYGFSTLHTDFKIQGCTFEDIGRDGIMLGGVVGGDIAGNFFRRIGYICTDDVSAGIPRWINGQWAVGLDTAGLTRGVSYRGNSFVSCYGAAIDLDGFAEGVVSDNTVIVPAAGEPEYTEDAIASWAGNYCYGAQTSNTNNLADAAVGVRVTGNRFRNCGLGAIRMYASRRGTVAGNTIEHPATASVAPIILGNIGSGANQRASGNTVTDNDVYYSPASPVGIVQEDANGFNFTSGDVNRVYGNRLHGTNTFEFLKHSTSGSRTAQEFASAKPALTAESKTVLQREDGYWRGYWVEAGVSKAVFSLLDRVSLSGGGFGGALWNVSTDAVGGVITTAGRTTSAFDDAVLTGKVYADGFLAVAATTYAAAQANLLADTVGLIRYNATSKVFEKSTAVSAGARVWEAFGSSQWVTAAATQIYYPGRAEVRNSIGEAVLSAAVADGSVTTLSVSNSSLVQVGGYYGLNNEVVKVTGVSGSDLTVERGAYFSTPAAHSSGASLLSPGIMRFAGARSDMAWDLRNGAWGGSPNAAVAYLRPASSGRAMALDLMPNSSAADCWIDICSNDVQEDVANWEALEIRKYATGRAHIGTKQLGSGSVRPLSLNEFGGQVSIGTSTFSNSLLVAAAATDASGITISGSANPALTLTNGTKNGYFGLVTIAGRYHAGAVVGGLAIRNADGIGLTTRVASGDNRADLYLNSGGNVLIGREDCLDDSSGARLQVNGFVRAITGFATPSSATDAIQATVGGVTARFLIGTRSLTLVGDTAANAGVSGLGQGRIYFDSSTNKFRVSENGAAFQDLTGPGVISLAGTANQVIVSAATGAVTLSLPQNIHTGATPTFAGATFGGNVGIGTPLPTRRLVVSGEAAGTSSNFNGGVPLLRLEGSTPSWSEPMVEFAEQSNAPMAAIAGKNTGSGAGDLILLTRGAAGSLSEKVRVKDSGNVLIGTTAQVNFLNGLQISKGATDPQAEAGSLLLTGASTAHRLALGYSSTYSAAWVQSVLNGVAPTALLLNPLGGNVGIGIPSPGSTIHVAGTASFGATSVNSTGSGYVATVTGGSSKTANSDGTQFSIFSNDALASNPLTLVISTVGNAAASSRFGYISVGEYGTGNWRTLALQPFGGNVGIGMTSPVAKVDIWTNFGGRALNISGDNGTTNLAFSAIGGVSYIGRPVGGGVQSDITIGSTGNVLVATAVDDSSGARLQVNGFVRAITGFATPSSATDAIQATVGGVTARFLIGTRSLTLAADTAANAGLSAAGQGRIYFDSSTNKFRVSENGGAYVDFLGVTSLTGTVNQVNVSAASGAVTLSLPQSIHTGATPTFAGVVSTVFNATATGATIAFQTNNSNFQVNGNGVVSSAGGYNAGGLNVIDATRNITSGTILATAPATDASGITISGSANPALTLTDGTKNGYFGLVTIAGRYHAGAVVGGLAIRNADGIGLTTRVASGDNRADLYLNSGGNVLIGREDCLDDSSGARLQVNGFVRAITGFATPSSATDAIQATVGGVTARFLVGTRSLTLAADTAANAGLSAAGQGRIYFDSSTNKFRVSENGGAYVDFLGVTSLTGTANQVNVSAATGAVTLSLPQNIHTGASPTFAGVTAGAFSATASGASIGFQTSNFNFQVNGNGVVSSAGGINVSGVTCINTAGQFVGLGVNMPSYGVAASGFNPYSGVQYFGQTLISWTIISALRDNGGTKEYKFRTVDFRGGVITSISAESAWTAF